ncbi:tail fiber assembly protein [Pseudomonas sp. MH2]|uniref:Tail fiber assembly protein n=1 Tax=Pseudomonas machongensis TaxID=3110229 RepID=A0ABU5VIP8_9PSED|nr:tail fiber assembly protein [Pseudomonas sp. MH2]MEA5673240.1 tail fiber assembly protein [Pseudomonas sp. MH2]
MIIKLSPVRSDETLAVSRQGDTLIVNGISLDFGPLPDGATLPASAIAVPCLIDPIERTAGKLIVSLRLPHAADAPESARFPVDIVDPSDGPVELPGLDLAATHPSSTGVIDWTKLITADQKAQAAAEQMLALVQGETSQRRSVADAAIAPLQDAVDLDEATEAEAALLKEWKRYRIALNRLPDQAGYPATIDWPAPPA